MSLPSFSLQSSWAHSDCCWDAQVLIYPCIFQVAWGVVPWLENLEKIQVME